MLRASPPPAHISSRARASYHTSSHFRAAAVNPQYTHWTKDKASKVRQQCFPNAKTVLVYGGLQMILPRVFLGRSKDPQFKVFRKDLRLHMAEVCVLMALSNDDDKLLFKGGKPLELRNCPSTNHQKAILYLARHSHNFAKMYIKARRSIRAWQIFTSSST